MRDLIGTAIFPGILPAQDISHIDIAAALESLPAKWTA